jgi:uncharacterized protein (TIRG00374 family)
MSARAKKILVLLLKLAVLVGIAEYARRQAQMGDALAVRAPAGVALVSTEGRATRLAAGTKLRVVAVTRDARGQPLVYEAAGQDGDHLAIGAADVHGDGAAFALVPGFRTLLRDLRWSWLWLAFAVFGPPIFLMAVRWHVLMKASGIDVPLWTLVRLHYLGFFFNTFMPGGAGGDVVKAVYLMRHCSRHAEAATMVVIDRVVGLLGLLAMAGTVVLAQYRTMHDIAAPVGAFSLAFCLGLSFFFSATLRKLVRYEELLARLPRADVLRRIDGALYGLRLHKRALTTALGLTVGLQLLEVVAVFCAGQSLGLTRPRFSHYLAFVPIGFVVNSLPISFGGIGLMEGAFLALFRDAGVASATEGFMLGMLVRLLVAAWGLFGALSALFPPQRAKDEAATAAAPPALQSEAEPGAR